MEPLEPEEETKKTQRPLSPTLEDNHRASELPTHPNTMFNLEEMVDSMSTSQ